MKSGGEKCLLFTFYFIFTSFFTSLHAQKEANIWYFGENAALDFNSGTPLALSNSDMNTVEGCASISDTFGNLLFYTNGVYVWNKLNVKMPNGFGLMGNESSSQSSIIIPGPDQKNIYYIFTVDAEENNGSNGLRYSVVDLSLLGGLGDITTKNTLLFSPASEKLTAVRHANNKDVWVIAHQYKTMAFYAYLVIASGVSTTPKISNTGSIYLGSIDIWNDNTGCLKVSPNGKRLASTLTGNSSFEVFDFNNSNGSIYNPITFPSNYAYSYGIEFSADSKKLYCSTALNPNSICQVNLDAGSPTDIKNSAIIIGSSISKIIGSLQLGPDKKIYVSRSNAFPIGEKYLGVINNPEILGSGCNYIDDGVFLAGKDSQWGLPNFIQSYFDSTFSNKNVDCNLSDVFLPNAFSPNGDGFNDSLFVKGICKKTIIEFSVFNRWGTKVFKTNDINIPWDGKYNNTELNSDIFFYQLSLIPMNGEIAHLSGNFSLIK